MFPLFLAIPSRPFPRDGRKDDSGVGVGGGGAITFSAGTDTRDVWSSAYAKSFRDGIE